MTDNSHSAIQEIGTIGRRRSHRSVRQAIDRHLQEGIETYGELGLDEDRFGAALIRIARAREPRDAEPSPRKIARLVDGLSGADLYLAMSCDQRIEPAWATLKERFLPRIRAIALLGGLDDSRADEVAGIVMGDLALRPAGGESRTRIGAYEARSSLLGWLGVITRRRVNDHFRRRHEESFEEAAHSERARLPGKGSRNGTSVEDPAQNAMLAEDRERLGKVFRDAVGILSGRERAVLRLKIDDVPQKTIARVFGVGESRLSRILKAAVQKIESSIREKSPHLLRDGCTDPHAAKLLSDLMATLADSSDSLHRVDPVGQERKRERTPPPPGSG